MAELVVTRHITAPPQKVFDAFLDPQVAARFLFATENGTMIRAETDPRVGGRFAFVDRRPGTGDVLHEGVYEVIEPPKRLVFTFAAPQYDPEVTRVSIVLVNEYGGTHVTLTHEGVKPEWELPTMQGWSGILEGLALAVAA
jgi:uncharacterized protein YndB with AHSA1/START domain